MSAVTVAKRTALLVDELIPLWQEETKSDSAAALIARSAIDSLLDLRAFATEFDEIDIQSRTAA